MHFETKIINGKPSIFFTEEKYPVIKKGETRSKTRKDLNLIKSISGEEDVVVPTPNLSKKQQHLTSSNSIGLNSYKPTNNLRLNLSNEENKNLNREQIIKPLKTTILQNNLNINNNNISKYIDENPLIEKYKENIEIKKPTATTTTSTTSYDQGSNYSENIFIDTHFNSNKSNFDKESYSENLNQQPVQQLPIFKSTMTLAEKKRMQWQQERENLEMVARHSNSINNLTKIAKNDNDFNYEKVNLLRQANSLDNLNLPDDANDLKNTPFTNPNRFTLMQKKKQKWDQDLKEQANTWSPFARNDPVAEATAILNDPQITQALYQQQQQLQQQSAYENLNPKTKKYKNSYEEYQNISKTLQAIAEVENKIKKDQITINEIQNKQNEIENNKKRLQSYDQSKVPAAMRTSLMFGDVLFDDEIKKTKELERKKWLEELEFQKRDKLLQSQKNLLTETNTNNQFQNANITDRNSMNNADNKSILLSNRSNNSTEERSFARTRNLLDPAQIEDLERKKQKNLQHVKEIEAQILEKKRIQTMENDMQSLKSLGMDNNNNNQMIITDRATNRKGTIQNDNFFDIQKSERDSNNSNTDSRIKEAFRTTKLAELSAAEEKHNRLLKRLKHGGHDVKNLEKKFNEYKAKIMGEINEDSGHSNSNDKDSYRMNENIFDKQENYGSAPANASYLREKEAEKSHAASKNDSLNNRNKNFKDSTTNDNSSVISEKKIQQIFNILREDTEALPAEVTENQLKALIKNVMLSENKQSKPNQTNKIVNPKEKKVKSAEKPKLTKPLNTKDMKPPIWNYKNLNGQRPVKNSEKDPFFKERQMKKVEQKQQMVERNNQKFNDYISSRNPPGAPSIQEEYERDRNFNDDASTYHNDISSRNSPMSNPPANRKTSMITPDNNSNNYMKSRLQSHENVLGLLNKNLGKNVIYEEDEDRNSINQELYSNSNRNANIKPTKMNDSKDLENGFVPFMRTNEFLDPAHATSPIPPSRETSAIKRDREKARQAYFQSMKPAEHGRNLNNYSQTGYRNKDPLLNNGLVKDNPTPRQTEILAQLAVLKQSLIKKQKEVASSIAIDDNNMNDYDDQNY